MTFTLAIPSKGRLKQASIEMFQRAGFELEVPQDARSYQGVLKGVPGIKSGIDVVFLPASEIASELVSGNLHAGITGEDLARESVGNADDYLDFAVPLGFGYAQVVIAVPDAWIDVTTMADLDDVAAEFRSRHGRRLRIATKYWQLTQNFFAGHGIAVYRIVESLGATEAAPGAGQADIIVDITSTGTTMVANNLKLLGDGIILQSQANLIISKTADFSTAASETAKQICLAIADAAGE